MQNLSLDKQLLIFFNEAFDKRLLFAVTFSIISITIVIVGLLWPKTYVSSTTLLWNKARLLKPLLEGTAAIDTGNENSRIAREVIHSNKNLQLLIDETGLNITASGGRLSDRDNEILKAKLRTLILLEVRKNNIIKISYKNSNPELAFHVVSVISQLFIEESASKKKTDSTAAYKFIEKQVNEYLFKLEAITKSIDEYKSQNIELQVDTTTSVNARVSNLKEKIKLSSLELKEAQIQKDSLTEQLAIESAKSNFVEEENVNNERLISLENRLNTLRLSYTEGYPDIVQLKEQIRNLKNRIAANAISQSSGAAGASKSAQNNLIRGVNAKSALFQRLRQQLSAIETRIRTLTARKNDQAIQLEFELGRSGEVSRVFNRLQELSRDYGVTKTLYDRFLTKRENARVSLNLENENAGSVYEIQEPPTIPLVPQGFRFLHFVLGSIFMGFAIPGGIIFGLLLIDTRIRHEDEIAQDDSIPIIGVVPIFKNNTDLKKQRFATVQSGIIFFLSLAALVTLSLSRFYEVI